MCWMFIRILRENISKHPLGQTFNSHSSEEGAGFSRSLMNNLAINVVASAICWMLGSTEQSLLCSLPYVF